jgi:hypothetical protein
MPPKQKKNASDGHIRNMYEGMPKKYLDDVFNPNFESHKMEVPFRCVVNAPSGSGKSNFLLNILDFFSDGKYGTFKTITIVTRNKDEKLYNWLRDESKLIDIFEGMEKTPNLDDYDKEFNHLLIWDDLVLNKNLKPVEEYYIRARKMNVSVVFLSQKYHLIPPVVRGNCNYMVILKIGGQKREINLILSEFSLGVTKEQLFKIYEYATSEKFSTLYIDVSAKPEERFRKGFLEILDIPSE